ncbi:MAG: acyl-CoA dehydrogenase family protein [Candidatus Binatia bacterium]
MDFAFSQEQEALRELARSIFQDHVTHDRLKALEARDEWFDAVVWSELGKASLLGVAVPEAFGGSGLGFTELCLVLEEVGRAVAPVPVLASLALGGLPLAQLGTPAQQRRWLPAIASGEAILSAALVELGAPDPEQPAATARRDGGGWRLDGVKTCVPAAEQAACLVVPARTGEGTAALFLVDPRGSGVRVERQILTNREPHGRVTLSGAMGEALGDPAAGAAAVRWLHERAVVAYCATQVGVCDRALRMMAEYTAGREQFDRPIASFQAVHQRAADAYIDLEATRLATWEAVYRLSEDLPATDAVTIAKFWAAEGGQRAVVAAQHLHGGIGVDVDYPLHRYFLWSKHIELALGSAPEQLARLGAALAATPAAWVR